VNLFLIACISISLNKLIDEYQSHPMDPTCRDSGVFALRRCGGEWILFFVSVERF
jgi:hypothetical protein